MSIILSPATRFRGGRSTRGLGRVAEVVRISGKDQVRISGTDSIHRNACYLGGDIVRADSVLCDTQRLS
jgi:hypothetical protein